MQFTCYSTLSGLQFVEAMQAICKNIQYFIRSKLLFRVLAQLNILCRSAVKLQYAKFTFTFFHVPKLTLPSGVACYRHTLRPPVCPVCNIPKLIEAENFLVSSSDLSSVDFSLWGVLWQKLYSKDQDIDLLKHVLLHCWVS